MRRHIARTESWEKQKLKHLRFRESCNGFRWRKISHEHARADLLRVDSAAIIAHGNDQPAILVPCVNTQPCLTGLSHRQPISRRFDAVIDRVRHEMRNRGLELVENIAIHARTLARDL